MAQVVQSNQVLIMDAEWFGWPAAGLSNKMIVVVETEIVGPYWVTPQPQFGNVAPYSIIPAGTSSTPPNPSACKTLRLKSNATGIEMYIAILNTDCVTSNTYATLANDTSGGLPVMPTVPIPAPIIQNPSLPNPGSTDTIFYFGLPDNPNGLDYACPFPWINGANPSTPFPASSTTPSGLVTALNSAWGTAYNAAGGFTLVSTPIPGSPATTYYSVKVVSTVAGSGTQILAMGCQVSLVPHTYTVTLPSYLSPVAVDGILINGTNALFFTGGILLGDHNATDLINSLVPLFEPTAVFALVGSNQVTVKTVQHPTYLTIGGANTALEFS